MQTTMVSYFGETHPTPPHRTALSVYWPAPCARSAAHPLPLPVPCPCDHRQLAPRTRCRIAVSSRLLRPASPPPAPLVVASTLTPTLDSLRSRSLAPPPDTRAGAGGRRWWRLVLQWRTERAQTSTQHAGTLEFMNVLNSPVPVGAPCARTHSTRRQRPNTRGAVTVSGE